MATCDSERPEGFTYDPEYNLRSLHTTDADKWYEQEEPADNTYHPHEEALIHETEPQNGNPPAYLPKVNTEVPDAAAPAAEPGNMHIMTYGTVEDVAFADGEKDGQRKNGLVQMSIRDEFDDLIHTDFHTANPLSLLNESNVKVGKRVRIDIQDYKNVIEWFVYNYPTLLRQSDLTTKRASDGTYYTGGSISADATYKGPTSGGAGEDWEHTPTAGFKQFNKSFLEIGQMDGNKKIAIAEFLKIIQDYFHIDDIWKILRDFEKRTGALEKDVRSEDTKRESRIFKTFTKSDFTNITDNSDWWDGSNASIRRDGVFTGNSELKFFTLNIQYNDSVHASAGMLFDPWTWTAGTKGGAQAEQIMKAGSIPQAFRPSKFQWVPDYGLARVGIGGHSDVIFGIGALDFGFDPDGSVYLKVGDLSRSYVTPQWDANIGVFGPNGTGFGNWAALSNEAMNPWHWYAEIMSFGGLINIGTGGTDGSAW